MTAALSPPPWEDVGALLIRGVYMYVLLVFLALVCDSVTRFPALRRLSKPKFRYHAIHQSPVVIAAFDIFTRYGIHIAVFRMLASTGICVAYVYSTYVGSIGTYLLYTQRILATLLVFQFMSNLFTSLRPIQFIFHGESIMEVFSLASLLMAKSTDWLNFSFLQAYIVLSRYFQIESALELVFMEKTSPFHRQLTRLTLEFIVFIYVFACGLQLFERLGDPWQTLTTTTFELTLANSFYFTVVTIFTVGYGDFVPYTLMGRIWIICIIVFGAYLVTRKIGQVVDVVSGLRRGLGSFVKGEDVDHCVICGNVKWEYLKSFVQEFYGDPRNATKKLVVICDNPNWTEETWNKFFTAHAPFRNHVTYLEGSCVSRDDLDRAQVDDAKAVFVLNNQHNPDPYAEDSETLKRILTIRSYAPNLPIYSMCALRDSMLQITYALEHVHENEAEEGMSRRASLSAGLSTIAQEGRRSNIDLLSGTALGVKSSFDPTSALYSGDFEEEDDDDGGDDDGLFVPNYDGSSDLKSEAICMQEVEMSLLAENVFCNGLSTLLANLILRVNPQTKESDQPWSIEYKIGSECRFEYVKLPMALHHKKFADIAMIMYDFGVLLIATKRFMDKKWRAITPDTTIHLNTVGLIITFHSATFLDRIMQHIATLVNDIFNDDEINEANSQDLPSIEENFSDETVPRYNFAGDLLTGDVSLAYDAYESPTDDVSSILPQFQSAAVSWSAPRTMEGPASDPTKEPMSDPRSLPESSMPQSPLRAQQTQDQAEAMVFTNNPLPTHPTGISAEGTVPQYDTDTERSLPKPSLSRATKLNVPQIEESIRRLETLVEDGDSSGSNGNPRISTATTQSKDLKQQAGTTASSVAGAETEKGKSTDTDKVLDSEETPKIARRTSFRSSGKRATHKLKQHVSFNAGAGEVTEPRKRKPKIVAENADKDQQLVFFGNDELPVALKGHIVVCAIGQMAMMNLKIFLDRVWIVRGPFSRTTPVVAICPRITDEDEADLSGYPHGRLFLIQGNSLSVQTLRRAQFDKAKAIIILACEDKNDIDDMDAKAIFTIMTLDYLLGERSETFVCTMLDAEESMQLLRAPANPRRRGADLAQDAEPYLDYALSPVNMRSGFSRLRSSQSTSFRYRGQGFARFDSRRSIGGRSISFGAMSTAGNLPRSMSFVGYRSRTYTNRKRAIERRLGIGDPHGTGRKSTFPPYGLYGHPQDEDEDIMNNPSMGGTSALNFLLNPSTISMGAGGPQFSLADTIMGRGRGVQGVIVNRARDESFEKQRYASGEMMISSTYMSLLIREYAMPGLMAVVRKIFGAGIGNKANSKRCWIRTVRIPKKWIEAGDGGRRIYREVVEALLEHSAVAVGLYRSGDVMVRVQLEVDPERHSDRGSATPLLSESLETDTSGTPPADEFDSANLSDGGIPGLELGGDSVPRMRTSRSFERGAILQNLPSYGAIQDPSRSPLPQSAHSASAHSAASGDATENVSARVTIPPSLMFDMAEDVQAARQSSDGGMSERDLYNSYTCPSSGRTALFKEVPGGENVLPYVYTNPEAYTLVSEHDAVYILVSPQVTIPEDWASDMQTRE